MKLEEAKTYAIEKAVSDGYDRIIFRTRKKNYAFKRTTNISQINKKDIAGYVRLYYKDNHLDPRFEVA